jgi:hypothetical protein
VALIESAQKELVNIGCLPRFETKESHNNAAETDDSRWHLTSHGQTSPLNPSKYSREPDSIFLPKLP